MLGRLLRGWGVAALLVLLATPSALAQATGKVQGRVVDAQTGEPIGGATVRVLGTTRGGISGEDGFYFINEVPAGLHSIVAEFIGRRTFRIENQRVLAGQTTTLDFQLEAAAIEIEPLVVEGERNPLVPRDQVSSKAIVTGELINAAPVDNAQSIVLLLPGVIDTNQGRTIRGSRPNEEAVYIDGVITRRYSSGEAEPIELPTNALAEIGVTTGGMGAQFGEAQSGVVNYVTRSGGTDYSGSLMFMTDGIGPKDWRTGFNRLEGSFSGPLARNLSFFVAGVLEGQKYEPLGDGFNDVPIFVPSGTATIDDPDVAAFFGKQAGDPAIFRIERTGTPEVDSVDVAFPNFVPWDNGRTLPFNHRDEYTFVSKLSWGLGTAASFDISYKREREQDINLGVDELYNPDGFDGIYNTGDVVTLGGYFLLTQSATQALALDVKASYQHYFDQFNELDPEWLRDHRDPFLGFNFSNMKFLVEKSDFEVTEELVQAVRSGVLPQDELQVFPGNRELFNKNTLTGIEENLRINPYGTQRDFELSGFSGERAGGLEYREESNWWFSANLDWQAGRYLRFLAGGDLGLIDTRRARKPLHTGNAVPALNEPTRVGLFATGRLDIGDVVIDAGLRWDYLDPDGDYPRVPGFVFNVPDSLRADFVRLLPGEGPALDRLAPLEDCGGEDTADRRRREDGTLVCEPNFIAAETKSEISPRLGIAFPVTAKSTFRLSYSHSIQVPGFHQQGFGGLGAASGMAGLFADQYSDLQGGLANTNTLYGRDVDLPRTVLFEAGYRQLIGEDLVVDVAAYAKTRRNGLTFRKLPFEDPTTPGRTLFLNVLTNADYEQTRGVDLRVDKRFGQVADVSASYSFVDARGTGSDPYTYEGLILRRNTNLSVITGEPVVPPDVILPLEQSRRHTLAGTFALLFPLDYQQGTPVGSVLSDLGVFVTFRLASGLPYTRLFNSANGQQGPPTDAGLGGIPAEELNASTLPWERRLDLALTKGFRVGGQRARVFVDWRNPLNLLNTNTVYLETGTTVNELFKETVVNERLRDDRLDGDADIDDFDILAESAVSVGGNENLLNVYSLLQAERRYGDGDGFFTVEEQRAAFGAAYELFNGKQWLEESNQSLRLGIELLF